MEEERIVKGIWIPIEIWKDKNLTWNEKILFLEIDSYTSADKDCFFSNEYISELLGISETNANKTLSSLIKKGYVIKTKFDGRKRYVKSALSYSTTLPCQERQPSRAYGSLFENDSMDNVLINKATKEEKEKDKKEKKSMLFEECWVAYRRKGSKKKASEYWNKLSDDERNRVMPHIKSYVASRDLSYQKDFERYLRDRIFDTIVICGNDVLYDPSKNSIGEYSPHGRSIWFDEATKSYWSDDNFYYGNISDGYSDDDRPDGAKITLNNARGVVVWNRSSKKWEKQ